MADHAQDRLDEWHSTWKQYIQPHQTTPSRLQLNFICDVADSETGLKAAQPFLAASNMPLAGCSIRLHHRAEPNLRALAEQAVAVATGRGHLSGNGSESETAASFRFLNLPTELRHHILGYTDLATPLREVEWTPSHGLYFRYRKAAAFRGWCPNTTHGMPSVQGRSRPIPRDFETPYLACWEECNFDGCYCRASHAASSSIFRCDCWAPPTSLFLVSRAVRQDALQVFYGLNRFVVAPDSGETWEAVSSPPCRLPISIFLSELVPKDAFQHLRFLEIVFPPFGHSEPCTYCPRHSPEWNDWVKTLEDIKDRLNIAKLTIRVHFAAWIPLSGTFTVTPYRKGMTGTQSQAIQTTYVDIVTPLERLRGLGRFFAHLADPQQHARGHKGNQTHTLPSLEQEVEQIVMGTDYDSSVAGKARLTDSQWVAEHWRYRTEL